MSSAPEPKVNARIRELTASQIAMIEEYFCDMETDSQKMQLIMQAPKEWPELCTEYPSYNTPRIRCRNYTKKKPESLAKKKHKRRVSKCAKRRNRK